jgi:CheY-like chemotaxis protein
MNENRPKLLVLEGPLVPAAEIAQVLGDRYDVAVAGPGVGQARLASGLFQVVFAGAGDLPGGGQAAHTITDREAVALLATVGEGLCLATVEGTVLWSNERFRALDEQTRARIASVCRLAGQRFIEGAAAAAAPAVASASGGAPAADGVTPADRAAGPSQPVRSHRFDVASPDESRYYEVVVSPVFVPPSSGDPTAPRPPAARIDRVAAVVWDVTSARRTQQKMDAIDRAGAELVRLDAEQIRKMHVGERLKVLEEKIVRFSHDLLHFDHLAIRLIDDKTGKLELVMASGLPPEAMEVELYAKREGNGIMGYVAATGRSYLCADVTQDKRYVIGLHNARSSLTVPLRLHDRIIGAFNVESERVGAFTEEDRQFAEMFANHVALALHILDLLVVERCATGQTVTGTVQGELNEPLEDILHEADWLKETAAKGLATGDEASSLREHIDRIMADVEAIRRRVRDAAEGPQTILGAEKALMDLALEPGLAGKRVLVADDEQRIRQTIRDVLRGRGCNVVVCDSGARAVAELNAAAVSRKRFDLVISDIRMPDHNGYEVFAAARRTDKSLPVILMTGFGYDPHHSIVRASQDGLQCVLFKPFQAERLLEEVRKALGVKRTSPA